MPKVSRDAAKQPLQEVVGPAPMDAEDGGAAAGTSAAGPLPDKPAFAPLGAGGAAGTSGRPGGEKVEFRRVPVPQHRMTPLKTAWLELYKPITENMKLDMRMNLKTKKVGACARQRVRSIAALGARARAGGATQRGADARYLLHPHTGGSKVDTADDKSRRAAEGRRLCAGIPAR